MHHLLRSASIFAAVANLMGVHAFAFREYKCG